MRRGCHGVAGGTGEWVVREPRVLAGQSGGYHACGAAGCGERTAPSRFAVRGPCPWGQDPLRCTEVDDRVDTR